MNALLRLEHAALPDGEIVHLVMLASSGKASAAALVRDADRTSFGIATGLLQADAIHLRIDALLARLSVKPLTDHALNRFDLHQTGGARSFHSKLHNLRRALDGDRTCIGLAEDVRSPPDPHPLLGLPYDTRRSSRLPPFAVSGDPPSIPDLDVGIRCAEVSTLTNGEGCLARIGFWLGKVDEDFQPGGGLRLDAAAWSPEAVAFYAQPGRIGEWRRQSAKLYPAFARTILHDPVLRAAVDAGRPIEARLAEILGQAASGLRIGPGETSIAYGITPAKVRRLRSYPRPLFDRGDDSWEHLVRTLSRIPLANVPDKPEGWNSLRHCGFRLVSDLTQARIPLETALADVRGTWDLQALCAPPPGQDVGTVLIGMWDMASRLANTLLRPAYGESPPPGLNFGMAGMHLLFAGDGVARMARRQREWHADLVRLNPILDEGIDLTWRALFEPFVSDGVEIRCLTSSTALDEEGGQGLDASGMAGLDHCVAGYARSCHQGLSHVASVVLTNPDGIGTRLATVEIEVDWGEFTVRQLRGRGNEAPPAAAVAAVTALMKGLNAGSHPHDRLAARPVEPEDDPEITSIDLPKIYGAWLRHLPTALRVADPKDFPRLLRDRIAAVFGPPQDGRDPVPSEEPPSDAPRP